jgi:hypothetical protein
MPLSLAIDSPTETREQNTSSRKVETLSVASFIFEYAPEIEKAV